MPNRGFRRDREDSSWVRLRVRLVLFLLPMVAGAVLGRDLALLALLVVGLLTLPGDLPCLRVDLTPLAAGDLTLLWLAHVGITSYEVLPKPRRIASGA